MTSPNRGAGRLAAGLVLAVGLAGGAEHGPVLLQSAPLWALAVGLGVWGAERNAHGPSLPRMAKWWAGRTGVQARRARLYVRAGGRA